MSKPTPKLDRVAELRAMKYGNRPSVTAPVIAALRKKVADVPVKKPKKAR